MIAGLMLEEITDEILEAATRAFLKHPLSGHDPDHIDILNYPVQARETFRKDLQEGGTHCEGFRFGVSGWGHTKWRFKIDVFGDGLFRFLLSTNCDKKDQKRVTKTCQKIADDLTKAGYPTIVS